MTRADRLVPERDSDLDALNQLAGKLIKELLSAAYQGTNQALRKPDAPSSTFSLKVQMHLVSGSISR